MTDNHSSISCSNRHFAPKPDTMEMQLAYWETYRAGYLFSLYTGGESLLRITKDRNMPSIESLENYFDKHHPGWRELHPAGVRRMPRAVHTNRVRTRVVSAERNDCITWLLSQGFRVKDIANHIGINPHNVSRRIVKYNLREVAANAAHKPAYAAA